MSFLASPLYRWLVIGGLGLAGVAIVVLVFWFHDATDLDRLHASAEQAGFPRTPTITQQTGAFDRRVVDLEAWATAGNVPEEAQDLLAITDPVDDPEAFGAASDRILGLAVRACTEAGVDLAATLDEALSQAEVIAAASPRLDDLLVVTAARLAHLDAQQRRAWTARLAEASRAERSPCALEPVRAWEILLANREVTEPTIISSVGWNWRFIREPFGMAQIDAWTHARQADGVIRLRRMMEAVGAPGLGFSQRLRSNLVLFSLGRVVETHGRQALARGLAAVVSGTELPEDPCADPPAPLILEDDGDQGILRSRGLDGVLSADDLTLRFPRLESR